MKRKGLGRGLDALIPQRGLPSLDDSPTGETTAPPPDTLVNLPLNRISPNPEQPRSNINEAELANLAQSISQRGILQPVLVRPVGDRYELVVGERRWAAAARAGLTEIPAIIRTVPDHDRLELALIENLQRQNLNPIEEAQAYRQLIDRFSLTQEQLAERIGKARTTIANQLRLLDLEPDLQAFVADGKLPPGQARAVLALRDSITRRQLAFRIIDEQLSTRQAEALVRSYRRGKTQKRPASIPVTSVYHKRYAEKLQQALQTRVRIAGRGAGGSIIIDFLDDSDLERVLIGLGMDFTD